MAGGVQGDRAADGLSAAVEPAAVVRARGGAIRHSGHGRHPRPRQRAGDPALSAHQLLAAQSRPGRGHRPGSECAHGPLCRDPPAPGSPPWGCHHHRQVLSPARAFARPLALARLSRLLRIPAERFPAAGRCAASTRRSIKFFVANPFAASYTLRNYTYIFNSPSTAARVCQYADRVGGRRRARPDARHPHRLFDASLATLRPSRARPARHPALRRARDRHRPRASCGRTSTCRSTARCGC